LSRRDGIIRLIKANHIFPLIAVARQENQVMTSDIRCWMCFLWMATRRGFVTPILKRGWNKIGLQQQCSSSTTTRLHASKPSLIVFDLDNTLWTPELYQLRKLERQGVTPVAGKDVKLFPGAQAILDRKRSDGADAGTKFAVASRTKSGEWAHNLLEQFGIRGLFDYIEIFPGDKKSHFRNLQEASQIPFDEMLFFDDNRDGKFGNCVPVSELGVLTVHCPGGIDTEGFFQMGLDAFESWDKAPSLVEWDGTVTKLDEEVAGPLTGTIQMVNTEKGFGFIRYGSRGSTDDLFFHISDLDDAARETELEKGDEVSFTINRNGLKGPRAQDVMIKSAVIDPATASMRVFSMNLPFAALLANEYKTLETRNGTMFVPYEEGTKFLLHVGQRTYPDGNRHLEIMKSGGLEDDEIVKLKSLPQGFSKGMAVAILEIGITYETSVEERSEPEFQRNVGAYGSDSGKIVTEIKRIEYLTRGVKVSGKGGVFKANVPLDAIPDGWQ
jgi:magnesium-dependent phosphatase 1